MKRHSAQEIVAILRRLRPMIAQGRPVSEAVREVGITPVTYHRWKNKYEGLSDAQAAWVKQLEVDNARLRKTVADLTLDKLILAEAARGLLQNPVLRRAWVERIKATLNVSERRACQVLGQHRSTQRKPLKRMSSRMATSAVQPSETTMFAPKTLIS